MWMKKLISNVAAIARNGTRVSAPRSFIEPPYLLQFSALRLFSSSKLYRHFARIPMNLLVGSHLNLMQLLKFGATRLALAAGVILFVANSGTAQPTAVRAQASMNPSPSQANPST